MCQCVSARESMPYTSHAICSAGCHARPAFMTSSICHALQRHKSEVLTTAQCKWPAVVSLHTDCVLCALVLRAFPVSGSSTIVPEPGLPAVRMRPLKCASTSSSFASTQAAGKEVLNLRIGLDTAPSSDGRAGRSGSMAKSESLNRLSVSFRRPS
jgi:hypothetical protein